MKFESHFSFLWKGLSDLKVLNPFQAGYVIILYNVVSCVGNSGNIVSVCGVFSSPWLMVCKS